MSQDKLNPIVSEGKENTREIQQLQVDDTESTKEIQQLPI